MRITVVGGGIVGCLTARRATDTFPHATVTLLERDLVGLGASQRSAGVDFPRGRTRRVRSMSNSSRAYYDDLKAGLPALPIHPLAMEAVAPAGLAPGLHAQFAHAGPLRAVGPGRDFGVPWPEGGLAWDLPGCRVAEVGDLVRSLVAGLRARAEVIEGVRAHSITERSDGVLLELGTGEIHRTDVVVLAPGPWANAGEWRTHTAGLGLRVKKIVALHVDRPVEGGVQGVLFPDEDAFLVPLVHRGHWLFSYTCSEWDVLPDEVTVGVSEANLTQGRVVLARYAPELARRIRSGRVFCDAYSPTGEPVVTRIGRTGRVVFAGAANGSGYRLAPAIAAEAVELLASSDLSLRSVPTCAS